MSRCSEDSEPLTFCISEITLSLIVAGCRVMVTCTVCHTTIIGRSLGQPPGLNGHIPFVIQTYYYYTLN